VASYSIENAGLDNNPVTLAGVDLGEYLKAARHKSSFIPAQGRDGNEKLQG
jgi:hypothetical protein